MRKNKKISYTSPVVFQAKTNLHEDIRSNFLEAVAKGLKFLEHSQYSTGEFSAFISSSEKMENAHYVKSVAMTIAVPYSVKSVHNKVVPSLVEKAIDFIIKEKEKEMFWRFFGKGSSIHPDLDDTSYALAFLMENNIKMNYQKLAKELLAYRNADGLFYTWFPGKKGENVVDSVVNTNVLYFFALLDWRVKEVEKWLEGIIKKREFINGSYYYHKPYCFIYFFSRLYTTKTVPSKDLKKILFDFLIDKKEQIIGDDDILNSILIVNSLLNMGYNSAMLKDVSEMILQRQNRDGGWPMGSIFKHRTSNLYYGSRSLTTALAIEAMTKYLKDTNNYF